MPRMSLEDASLAVGVAGGAAALPLSARFSSALSAFAPSWLHRLALATFVLCLLDATFTLHLISTAGFYEANPIMNALLEYDVRAFVLVKLALTGGGLALLLRHAHLRLLGAIPVTYLLVGAFFMYATLVSYEIGMLMLAA